MSEHKYRFTGDVPYVDPIECHTKCDCVDIEFNPYSDEPICVNATRAGSDYIDQGDNVCMWFTPEQSRAFAAKLIYYADHCEKIE